MSKTTIKKTNKKAADKKPAVELDPKAGLLAAVRKACEPKVPPTTDLLTAVRNEAGVFVTERDLGAFRVSIDPYSVFRFDSFGVMGVRFAATITDYRHVGTRFSSVLYSGHPKLRDFAACDRGCVSLWAVRRKIEAPLFKDNGFYDLVRSLAEDGGRDGVHFDLECRVGGPYGNGTICLRRMRGQSETASDGYDLMTANEHASTLGMSLDEYAALSRGMERQHYKNLAAGKTAEGEFVDTSDVYYDHEMLLDAIREHEEKTGALSHSFNTEV